MFLQCVECGKKYDPDGRVLTCPDHNPKYSYLELVYDYSAINQFPEYNVHNWDRFLPLLPINKFHISLNELSTTPVQLTNLGKLLGFNELYMKDETKNATGSFKDKESVVSVNKALELDKKHLFTISSGNGALSASAYSAKASLHCDCYVSNDTTKTKLEMISLFGGNIIKLTGSYEDIYEKTLHMKPPGWNVTSGVNPFGSEGNKITSFEIWESIGVPDYIVVPCGNGGNLYGIWKGFEELRLLGMTDRVPIMIGVQVKGAAPLKIALEKRLPYVIVDKPIKSIAEGIVAAESYASPKTLKALMSSGGTIITVTDTEIEKAFHQLDKSEMVIPELTAASAFAAISKLPCSPNSKIVVILTGTGLKYLSHLEELMIKK